MQTPLETVLSEIEKRIQNVLTVTVTLYNAWEVSRDYVVVIAVGHSQV